MPPRDHLHGRSWRRSSSRRSCRRCSRSFVPPPSVLTPSPRAPFSSLCAHLFLVAGPPFGPLSSFPAASTLLVASFHGVPLPCPGALRAKAWFPEPPRQLLIDLLGPSAFPSDCRRVKKQAFSPVWQVGPTGSALTRTVSSSQSTNRSFRTNLCPEVSPFSQSRFRERLQKWTDLVSSVFWRASAFLKPSMSTVPSRQSCTT